jgi:predicted Zn-dependent protease
VHNQFEFPDHQVTILTLFQSIQQKVLELSPDDLEIQIDYAQCLVQLGIAKKAEHLFYDNIISNTFSKYSAARLYSLCLNF